jgi:hypothetical protein
MSMQKYRADKSKVQQDGAKLWFADWIGGPTLSKIENCRYENMHGDMRGTVYITGEPDTFFSQPAVTSIKGCRVRGYVTSDDDGNIVFRHCYY